MPVTITVVSHTVSISTTYTFDLTHSLDQFLTETTYKTSLMGSSDTITITFPSQFTAENLNGFNCQSVAVNFVPATGYSCSQSNLTIIVNNAFADNTEVSSVQVVVQSVTNIPVAMTSSPFQASIGANTATPTTTVTYTAATLTALTISFPSGIVNRTSTMQFSLTLRNEIPIGGYIFIKFPTALIWARDISINHLIPINQTLTCSGTTSNVNNAGISCQGLYSTQIVTISGAFTAVVSAGSVVTIDI